MERSWTMVTVMGKGNWERMVLPSTPLLELTMYQQMHTNRMRTNSRTSDLDTSIPAATVWSLGGDYIRDVSHVVSRMLPHRNICTAITILLLLGTGAGQEVGPAPGVLCHSCVERGTAWYSMQY